MFTSEVLERCRALEERIADLYSHCAHNKESAAFWQQLAAEERHHARILAAERAAFSVEADQGYFMPEFPAKLAEMKQMLSRLEAQVQAGVTEEHAVSAR
jgi:hypothetical protein